MKLTCSFAPCIAAGVLIITSATVRASTTDDRIESSAQKSYVFKTYLKDDSIKTDSKNGAVTLTGTVANSTHKSLAQDTVEGLPGVKSVDNQLTINGVPPAEHSDLWIDMKVKSALLFHRNVGGGTAVSVKDGIVTLHGEASSLAQKDLTAEYAKDVDNVKAVDNQMTIAKPGCPPKPPAKRWMTLDHRRNQNVIAVSSLHQRGKHQGHDRGRRGDLDRYRPERRRKEPGGQTRQRHQWC